MAKCPCCGEEIERVIVLCGHCKEPLEEGEPGVQRIPVLKLDQVEDFVSIDKALDSKP